MHKSELPGAQETLDSISQSHPPSQILMTDIAQDKTGLQLGTLGGGNHFLEVGADSVSRAWWKHLNI